MRRFRIGDRVIVTNGSSMNGFIGTVVRFGEFDMIGVDFSGYKHPSFHNLGGYVEDNTGYWMTDNEIEHCTERRDDVDLEKMWG